MPREKSRRPAAARDRQNVRQRAECTGVHTSGTPCLLRHVGCLYSRGICTNGMGTNAPKGPLNVTISRSVTDGLNTGNAWPAITATIRLSGSGIAASRRGFWSGRHNERKAGKIVASARRDLPDDRMTTTRCQRSGRALRQRLLTSIVQDNLPMSITHD